jgi:hypothetical protein
LSAVFQPYNIISIISCNSRELGQQLKEEEDRLHKLKLEGYEVYQDYVKQGTEARIAKQVRMLHIHLLHK